MSKNKEQFEQKAKAFFADKKNSNINTVYFTSDGNMFRAEHYADNWKTQLKDREVVAIKRPSIVKDIVDKVIAEKGNGDSAGSSTTADDEKAALVKQYIELFDTKPHHKWSADKIREAIAAKESELASTEEKEPGEKHIVTEEDLASNPALTEQGIKVGDEITIPVE